MSRVVMQQALEALEGWDNHDKWVWPESALEQAKRNTKEAIPALRAALAEPEQPVLDAASSWFALVMCAAAEIEDASNCLRDEDAKRLAIRGAKYYRDAANALYTAPTPRRSVELTDAEILSVLRLTPPEPSLWPHLKGEAVVGDVQMAVIAIARAIEHAHGIGEQT